MKKSTFNKAPHQTTDKAVAAGLYLRPRGSSVPRPTSFLRRGWRTWIVYPVTIRAAQVPRARFRPSPGVRLSVPPAVARGTLPSPVASAPRRGEAMPAKVARSEERAAESPRLAAPRRGGAGRGRLRDADEAGARRVGPAAAPGRGRAGRRPAEPRSGHGRSPARPRVSLLAGGRRLSRGGLPLARAKRARAAGASSTSATTSATTASRCDTSGSRGRRRRQGPVQVLGAACRPKERNRLLTAIMAN